MSIEITPMKISPIRREVSPEIVPNDKQFLGQNREVLMETWDWFKAHRPFDMTSRKAIKDKQVALGLATKNSQKPRTTSSGPHQGGIA